MANLTAKQQNFLDAYLTNGRNAAEAYRCAYATKAAPQRASEEGQALLKHPLIAPRVTEALAAEQKATARIIDQYEVTAERITRELALLGFSNMADYMHATPDGDPYFDFSALTRDQAAALTEVTVEDYKEGRGVNARDVKRVKFKLADKRAALVDLGKTLKMFTDNVQLSSDPNAPPLIAIYLPSNER